MSIDNALDSQQLEQNTATPPSSKILMVEDDPFVSEMILKILTHRGFTTCSTNDGDEAIAVAETCKPDLIILDLMLPGRNGDEILQTLKQHQDLQTVPVIIFTNRTEKDDEEKLLALGAAKYLIKANTDIDELIAAIQELTA